MVSAVTRFSVTVDRAYFDVVVSEGELGFPDPVPPPQDLEVPGEEIHLGRTSESRAIHPDLDISILTGDPAVSSRHAVIRRAADGSLTVTDIGSTNGTFVGSAEGESITVGQPVPLEHGIPVFLGAWTRLVVVPDGAPSPGPGS
jgi:pSer/pThr/pTyr-binding forkhead associated (FHA) protein